MNINSVCPYCKNKERSIIASMEGPDKYLDLIDNTLSNNERHWMQCNACDFIYSYCEISESEAKVLYEKYRSFEFRKISAIDYFDKFTSLPKDKSQSYDRVDFIKSKIGCVKKILDVGCGGGITLFWLRKFFPDSYLLGLEPNSEYAKMVSNKLNISVMEEFYSVSSIEDTFDLTISSDVVEHIHDIDCFWLAAESNIKINKYLFIEVPSPKNFQFNSIQHEVFNCPHLYFYSKKHIEELSLKYGFSIISYKEIVCSGVYKDRYLMQRLIF